MQVFSKNTTGGVAAFSYSGVKTTKLSTMKQTKRCGADHNALALSTIIFRCTSLRPRSGPVNVKSIQLMLYFGLDFGLRPFEKGRSRKRKAMSHEVHTKLDLRVVRAHGLLRNPT